MVAETTTSRTVSASYLFFFCYYVVGVLIVCNLINSIIIQFYSDSLNEKSMSFLGDEKEKHKQLRESLITRLKQKRVIELWKCVGLPDFGGLTMEQQELSRGLRCAEHFRMISPGYV
jgi:hypothetical protein